MSGIVRIGLLGATGRMGAWVSRLVETEFKDHAVISARAGAGDDLTSLLKTDVVIDFSSSAAMAEVARAALAGKGGLPAFVVGSTGWKPDETAAVESLSKRTPVLISSNFSTGVTALMRILRDAAPLLKKLGYSPVVVETHHQHKKDAPSGTAISLQKAISPIDPASIQTHSIRSGEIIGDHEVTFYGPGDHLTLGHFAQDRSIFARGAIDVAIWLAHRPRQATETLLSMDHYFGELKSCPKT